MASESDFRKVTNELGPDELQHLFHNLGIPQRDIEHAEKSADTTDTRLKARAVLRRWKQTKGRAATREVLLEAKRTICISTGICMQFYIYCAVLLFSAGSKIISNKVFSVACTANLEF